MKKCVLKEILLKEGGISQSELSAKSGVSPNTISKLANDQPVTDRSIARVVKGLNIIVGEERYSMNDIFVAD